MTSERRFSCGLSESVESAATPQVGACLLRHGGSGSGCGLALAVLLACVHQLGGAPSETRTDLADVDLLRVVGDAGRIIETLIGLIADDDVLVAFLDAVLDVRGEIVPCFAGA